MNKDIKIIDVLIDKLFNDEPLNDLELLSLIFYQLMPKNTDYISKAAELLNQYGSFIEIAKLPYEKLEKLLNEDTALFLILSKTISTRL